MITLLESFTASWNKGGEFGTEKEARESIKPNGSIVNQKVCNNSKKLLP